MSNVFLYFAVVSFASVITISLKSQRIVNGIATVASDWPWIVSIQEYTPPGVSSSDIYNYCGGSLIRSEYPAAVLTAAHCIKGKEEQQLNGSSNLWMEVAFGVTDLDESPGTYDTLRMINFYYHEEYNEEQIINDIGIIFLDGNTSYTPIVLNSVLPFSTNNILTIIGYGTDSSGGSVTDTLEYARVSFYSDSECETSLDQYLSDNGYSGSHSSEPWDSILCAYHSSSDSCQGDSGGPLIEGTNSSGLQIGIVSWGYGCADSYPGVYTDVAYFSDWINMVLEYDGLNLTELNGGTNTDAAAILDIAINYMLIILVTGFSFFQAWDHII